MGRKITLLFPGQGSQYVGMGKDYILDEELFAYFKLASNILDFPLDKIMLEGPEKELILTKQAQPAILTYSIVILEKLKRILSRKEVEVERVLGHSVGEYAALVAANSFKFEDALLAVHLRGKYMQEAVPVGLGGMTAVLRVPNEVVEEACLAASKNENGLVATTANYNDPLQTVISGNKSALSEAILWIKSNFKDGRPRFMELKVSAPFHSPLMNPAAQKLADHLKDINILPNKIPYVANIDAKEYPPKTESKTIYKNLIDQVCGSVLWMQSVQSIPEDNLCLEVGPGKVLQGMIKRINPKLEVISLDSVESFNKLEEIL